MEALKRERLPIRASNDIVMIRHKVRSWATEIGLGIIDQTKVVTAASELARNTLEYGGGGDMEIVKVQNEGGRQGLQLIFEDQGPGIPDVALALTDGFTTGGGLGMGLSGARRLMNEFHIETEVGRGTRVTIVKWK